MSDSPGPARYQPPPSKGREPCFLRATRGGERFPFVDRLEFGRDDGERAIEPGVLLLKDPSVSRHHCVLTRRPSGRCFLRDESRNGTRLDGRRLMPHVEAECHPGQTIGVSDAWSFVLVPGPPVDADIDSLAGMNTVPHSQRCIATVLVGDITGYTQMMREALSEDLQHAVRHLYEALSTEVVAHGGTVKEFQGDAILAFWEGDSSGRQAVRACRAALALHPLAQRLARDPVVWPFPGHPLAMDWALSTGLVLLDSFGASGPGGLSLMGEPVVRAFRLEKFADASTGHILACRATQEAAGDAFEWRDLGERLAKGFELPDRVFALAGTRAAR
jgi:class 3 adenylate cyclase